MHKLRKPYLLLLAILIVLSCITGCENSNGAKEPLKNTAQNDWIIDITDSKHGNYKLPVDGKSFDFTATLYLVAWKQGGEEVYGKYQGKALVTFDIDIGDLSDEDAAIAGTVMFDRVCDNLSFEIVPYDEKEYKGTVKKISDSTDLAPLVTYNGMSSAMPEWKTIKWDAVKVIDKKTGKVVYDGKNNYEDEETYPMSLNLLISDKIVVADIPTYNLAWNLDFFRGKVTSELSSLEKKNPDEIFTAKMTERQQEKQNSMDGEAQDQESTSNADSNQQGSYMIDEEGREGFDTNGDGKLDMWLDEDGNMRMDLDKDGEWDPAIEGEYSDGSID